MNSISAAVNEYRNSDEFANDDITERINRTCEILVELQKQGYVKEDGIFVTEDSGLVWCYTKDDIILSFTLKDKNSEKHGAGITPGGSTHVGLDYSPATSSAEAYILYDYEAGDLAHDEVYTELQTYFSNEDLNVTIDKTVTYNDYCTCLSRGYELVAFSSHGVYADDLHEPWIITTLGVEASLENIDEFMEYYYESEDNCIAFDAHFDGDDIYGIYIRPGLFEKYYPSGSYNTVVIFEECESFGKVGEIDFVLAETFLENGFPYVVGYYNEVDCDYAHPFTENFIKEFFAGNSTGDAFSSVTNSETGLGPNDGDSPAGTPWGMGDHDYAISANGIINHSFDLNTNSSNVYGWNTAGDSRVVNILGPLTPTDGSSMAMISTGIGSTDITYLTSNEGSMISQSFVVPSDAEVLKFDYNMLSEEPMEWVGSGYNDSFKVYLEVNGSRDQVFILTINTANWILLNGLDFAGGDDTLYQTGWFTEEVDISDYAGEEVELVFVVSDVGDSRYDTVALIDNVRFG